MEGRNDYEERNDRCYTLPAAPGATIYMATYCKCSAHYAKRCQGQIKAFPTATHLHREEVERRGQIVYCVKVYERPFEPMKHLHKWGKTVFPTLEEAAAYRKKVRR